ncbi:MAG: glycosyltransferase involved in cell wall biosynthesis [Candidatus Poriferisodalaceae bacterium]|jgi:glycosyltransferase involved in cell wall biosynthesis
MPGSPNPGRTIRTLTGVDPLERLRDPWQHDRYAQFRSPVGLFGVDAESLPVRRICVLLGSTDISGGTYVVLQHVLRLQEAGHHVTIVPHWPATESTTSWHRAYADVQLSTFDEVADQQFDVAIATWWRTAYDLPKVSASHYVYFVQSIESRFHAYEFGATPDLIDATYDLPMVAITIAPWLQSFLMLEYERPAFLVPNGIDKHSFTPVGPSVTPRPRDSVRVLVEGPVDVEMKNVPLSIELARRAGATEIWLLTSSDVQEVVGVDRVFSRVPVTSTPAIYRSCDVLMKLTQVEGMFGPPLEMFHCGGTAVTWDVTGHEDYMVNDVNSLVVATGDREATVQAMKSVIEDPELLLRLKRGAARTASEWPSWEQASAKFADVVSVIASRPAGSNDELLASCAVGARSLP